VVSAYTVLVDTTESVQAPTVVSTTIGALPSPPRPVSFFSKAKVAGFAALLLISPVTTMRDPWLLDKQLRDAAVTVSVYRESLGRLVTWSEALQITKQILLQAERERIEYADWDAEWGLQMEEL